MSETPPPPAGTRKPEDAAKPKIHRVCIQCNNMFEVPADNFEAKQCSNCHKG